MNNILKYNIATTNEESVFNLLRHKDSSITRIVSPPGCALQKEWYNQDTDEWVIIIQGFASIEFENKTEDMKTGDFLHIKAHQKHRVLSTSDKEDTIWLAVYLK